MVPDSVLDFRAELLHQKIGELEEELLVGSSVVAVEPGDCRGEVWRGASLEGPRCCRVDQAASGGQ